MSADAPASVDQELNAIREGEAPAQPNTAKADGSAEASPSLASPLTRAKIFAGDIKIAHTVFALPFAFLSTFLAARGWPHVGQLLLILLCMVTARTVAMASNRLLDAEIDRRNPRTARRAIPSGAISPQFYRIILFICASLFVAATAQFGTLYQNWLPLILAVPVLAFVASYPYLKRFTRLCHYYLGASLALAPICAWIAIAGTVSIDSILLGVAVLCWTAGFDVIYACQDYDHDVAAGLYSVPAKLGIAGALWVSRVTHVVALAALITLGLYSQTLAILYFIGVWITAALLVVEHALVSPQDLTRVGIAFATINGMISVLLGTMGILDVFF